MTSTNTAIIPEPVQDPHWFQMHSRFLKEAKNKRGSLPSVLLIGASIIEFMQDAPIWDKCFVPLNSLNFGIGGDKTQHVLWRILNGELEFEMRPKIVIILVGSNNVENTPGQVADALIRIARETRLRLADDSHVVLLPITPKEREMNAYREHVNKTNEILEDRWPCEFAGDTRAHLLACARWNMFINPEDETISQLDMHDYLHFTHLGYEKLCEPIMKKITELLLMSNN